MKILKKGLTKRRQSPIIKISTMQGNNGFTIIELLLATAVFSLVLLGALAGFLRTGNLFYKGVSLTQTQAIAKQVVDDVSANLANSSSRLCGNSNCSYVNGNYDYYCVGDTRYTYQLNTPYIASANGSYGPTGNYALLKTTGVSGCPAPSSGNLSGSNTTEMLSDNMRLSEFLICAPGSGNLYNINVIVAYGSDSTLTNPTVSDTDCTTAPLATANQPSCTGSTQDQQFCAVSNLATSVYAGLAS